MLYHQSQLKNGLRVITLPMEGRHSVAVAIWVRAGSRYEPRRLSGITHFLEHMLFKGTQKRTTRQIKEAVEGVGGMLNAFTTEECTCYFAKLLKEDFPIALDVLADMVNNATLPVQEFEKERPVILEEIKMYRDQPAQYAHELMIELLWPDQPLGRPVAGSVETVSKMTRPQVVAYKQRHYHPANMVVAVAGPLSHNAVVDPCEALFGKFARRPLSRYSKSSSQQRKPRTFFLEKPTEQTHFVIGMHGFSHRHPDRYKLGVLNVLLGGNMSSRLFEEVRERRGLAYEIKSGLSFYEDTGSVLISAGVDTKKVSKTIRVILHELAKLCRKPVKTDELRRAKDYFMNQLTMTMEDTLDHMLWSCERAVYDAELPDPKKIKEAVESVTADEVQDLSRRLFRTAHLNLTLIGPVPARVQNQIRRDFEIDGQ